MEKQIKNIVDRILSEEIKKTSSRIKRRINENTGMCSECGGNMYEGECMECGNMYEGDIQELGGMDDGHPRFGNKNFAKMSQKEKEDLMSDRSYEDDFEEYDDDENEFDLDMDDYSDELPSFDSEGRFKGMSKPNGDMKLEEEDYDDDDDDYKPKRPSLSDLSRDMDYDDEPIRDREDYSTRVIPRRNENPRHFDSYSGLDEAKKLSKGQKYIAKQAKPYDKIDGKDFKKLRSKKKEVKEKLYGRQKSIDKNKNNKIDAEDFEILRKKKGKVDESYYSVVLDNRKFLFTENEMIDIIENIINEEKKKTSSLKKGRVSASNVLKSSLNKSGKEENDYIESVTKKMKEYLKGASKGNYETNPSNFPEGNYDLDKRKGKIKKYTPSEAVDEYIEAYSYPGNTNLVYDEIKPDDEKIEKYLKGHKTTGNAEIDEDGKPYGNVVPSKTGEKFYDNYKNNYYGQEQMNASYKRYPQDTIEVAGDVTKTGKIKKGGKTAQSILDKVSESVENKKVISEIDKMKSLIGYNQKTQ